MSRLPIFYNLDIFFLKQKCTFMRYRNADKTKGGKLCQDLTRCDFLSSIQNISHLVERHTK